VKYEDDNGDASLWPQGNLILLSVNMAENRNSLTEFIENFRYQFLKISVQLFRGRLLCHVRIDRWTRRHPLKGYF
jgi:hypothetical protein